MNKHWTRFAILSFLLAFLFACSSSTDSDQQGPKVVETMPPDGALNVVVNRAITANFDSAMDGLTLNNATFTLRGSGGALVPCVVTTVDSLAVLTPIVNLDTNTIFTATISTGAKNSEGAELEKEYEWSFTTGVILGKGPSPVALGNAGNYAILAKSGIDTVPTSVVIGDLGVSPAAATYITGFDITAHASNVYATSAQVTGKIYAADYAVPTPADLTSAISNMESAYVDAAGRTLPDHVNLGAGNISGMTLAPGLYKWGTGLLISSDTTLTGGPDDVWIFQIAEDLTLANGKRVILSGGALPRNIFWQSMGVVTIGTTAHLEGVVLAKTAIALDTGSTINGRLLSQTAVTIKSSTVTQP